MYCAIVHEDGAELSTLIWNQTRRTCCSSTCAFLPISLNYLFILAIIISSVVGPLLLILIAVVITIQCYSAIFCHKAAKEF